MSAMPAYTANEFALESRHIDTLIWESLCIERGERVLFCGFASDGAWVSRAIEAGADVSVIEHREQTIREFSSIKAKLVRGSTSVIPAKDGTYDIAIAFHYLHEADPFFHAQIVTELARVARRVAIVEPSPPVDPLGKRISLLYSQAKRELGQFEYYQPIDYWKRLLQAVKADVTQHVFAFTKVPPQEYLADTVSLVLDTMEVEEVPPLYLQELRAIAKQSGAVMLPQARFVVMGASAGELPRPEFSPRPPLAAAETPQQIKAPSAVAQTPAAPARVQEPSRVVTPEAGYEFPPMADAPAAFATPSPAAQPLLAKAPEASAFAPSFSIGAPPENKQAPAMGGSPFGAPFAIPSIDPSPFGFPGPAGPEAGWQWEPPEGEEF